MFLGSPTWHFPEPKARRIHGGRKPYCCCLSETRKKKIAPSSSDKPLIGPAHSPGNKGAGPPRQKVQTERLIGPLTPESGRPARAASTAHTVLSPTGIPKRAGPARHSGPIFIWYFLTFALFSKHPHNVPSQYQNSIPLYAIRFFSNATFCFVISGPSPRHLLL